MLPSCSLIPWLAAVRYRCCALNTSVLTHVMAGCLLVAGAGYVDAAEERVALDTEVESSQVESLKVELPKVEPLNKVSLTPWLAAEHRASDHASRNQYRNPEQTLAFFQVQSDHSVVEIWPGMGWYTELLAPYLKDHGQLYAAHFPAGTDIDFYNRYRQSFEQKLAQHPEAYSDVTVLGFRPSAHPLALEANTVDRVLTFRNVHNWMKAEFASDAFAEFFRVLKPGGLLGVVEHRAPASTSLADMISSGYVTTKQVVAYAQAAGFELQASSEINANPKDTANHPAGVWSLPPNLRLGDENREHYVQIGESDRMTLLFVKPSAKPSVTAP